MIQCPTCPRTFGTYQAIMTHWRRLCVMPSLADQFWMRVERGDGCWLWIARRDALGYGRFHSSGPYVFAHRAAWLFTHGEIPADKDVMHRCDVRACCNPAHLSLGTHSDNMRDMFLKERNPKGTRLTLEQVREIKAALKDYRHGMCTELARKYGVGNHVISKIKVGGSWTYV